MKTLLHRSLAVSVCLRPLLRLCELELRGQLTPLFLLSTCMRAIEIIMTCIYVETWALINLVTLRTIHFISKLF